MKITESRLNPYWPYGGHTFALTLTFFLSNVIFDRAHLSTFTIGRADSAEGHLDIRAE